MHINVKTNFGSTNYSQNLFNFRAVNSRQPKVALMSVPKIASKFFF